ncbi:alpha/beta hydrolase family protein [Streptomyces sp. CBMA152]|uniref:alpha/beta hydrolase n=1 Tax=Streptomyces sp. CBMA152 TaxID=1896312 RepID=UPI0016603ADB|nr:alpha/beta hydrolase family protein [Streptomyces sp. CBMA152]
MRRTTLLRRAVGPLAITSALTLALPITGASAAGNTTGSIRSAAAGSVRSATDLPPLPQPNSHGLTLKSWTLVAGYGDRMADATFTTAAVFTPRGGTPWINPVQVPVKVRIYLPAGYRGDPARPYPVLYLLHGGGADFQQWSQSDSGNLAATLAGSAFDGIVVMPEGGRAGWYSDWAGATDGHFAPQWETFHIEQLLPWIDANFPTVRERSGRAIAGVSMGGYGALRYGGRHPELFSAVGAFSAGTDLYQAGAQKIIADSMWQVGASIGWTGLLNPWYRVGGDTLHRMETVFGPQSGWAAVTPVSLALHDAYNGYAGKLALYAGGANGTGETDIYGWNHTLHENLDSRGAQHRFCTGPGEHSYRYWTEDLKDFVSLVYGTPFAQCPNGWGSPTP